MSIAPMKAPMIDVAPNGVQAKAAVEISQNSTALTHLHMMEYWETIGGAIGFLTILYVMSFLESIVSRCSQKHFPAPDVERRSRGRSQSPTTYTTWSALRFWRASKSWFKIALFRIRVPLASLHGIGNVTELLCIGAYFSACVTWSLVGVPSVRDASVWYYRTGMMAATQIPFVIALAGKNNVISFLTGLSHEKEGVDSGWGSVALYSLTITVLLSFKVVRNRWYEVFLVIHIALICVFVLAIMVHYPDAKVFVYPGFIIWGFDRSIRLLRMIVLNRFSKPSSTISSSPLSTGNISCDAPTITRLSEDTVRLAVRRSRNLLSSWRPGQHFFVVAPGISARPWEAHPFTAASISDTVYGTSGEDVVEISFIIRGRGGFTGRLLKHAIERESLKVSATIPHSSVIVDGPYGQPPDLGLFDTCILIAGGSGVSYSLSMLLGLIHNARVGGGKTSRVLFIWAIRDPSHLSWITPDVHTALGSSTQSDGRQPLDIDIRIFVTRESSNLSSEHHRLLNDNPSMELRDMAPSSLVGIKDQGRESLSSIAAETLARDVRGGSGSVAVEHGRPDLKKLIEEELGESDGMKVSVDVSGPGTLAQSVRSLLATSSFTSPAASLRGGPSVTLHTETFGW